jgi:hypothetical protein
VDRRLTTLAGVALLLGLASGAAAQATPTTPEATLIALPPAEAAPLPGSVELPAGSIAYVTGAETTGSWVREHVIETGADSAFGKGFEVEWRPGSEDATIVAYSVRGADTAAPSGTIHQWGCVDGVCQDRILVRDAWRPRWSPTGEAIAFSRSVIDLGDAWVRDLVTGKTTRLPGGEPEWSPTGEWLLVLEEDVDDLAVAAAVVRPDGSDERVLGSGWNATWSPDGQEVASTWTAGDVTSVSAVDIGSGETEELFAIEGAIADLRWLPGDTVAFVRGDHDGGDLYAVDLTDRSVKSLTSGLMVKPDLAVSPDGEWLAFSASPTDPAATGTTDIYLASVDGGWRPLVTGVDASMPAWMEIAATGVVTSTPQVGLAWRRVADRDLVSHPRNGSMHGVISGGPGAIAWGYIYGTGPHIWTTADGRDWVSADVETPPDATPEYPGEVLDVARADGLFVAVGSYMPQGQSPFTTLVWTSSDALTWGLIPDRSPFDRSLVQQVVGWDGGFLALGCELASPTDCGPARTWASADGLTWQQVTMVLPEGATRVDSVVADNDRLWGLASDLTGEFAGTPARLRRVSSLDGLTWTTSPLPRVGGYEQLHSLPGGLYLTVTRAKHPKDRAPLGVYRSTDSRTWTPLATGRSLGSQLTSVGDTLVMVGSKGACDLEDDRCVAAAWRSVDGGVTWQRAPLTGTPKWASRAWMTEAAALPDGTVVAVGTELKGGWPSTAAWVSVPAEE